MSVEKRLKGRRGGFTSTPLTGVDSTLERKRRWICQTSDVLGISDSGKSLLEVQHNEWDPD